MKKEDLERANLLVEKIDVLSNERKRAIDFGCCAIFIGVRSVMEEIISSNDIYNMYIERLDNRIKELQDEFDKL